MSARAATQGRPLMRTETVALPSERRRIVRSTPSRRGGLRNDGWARQRSRATPVNSRAAVANLKDMASLGTTVPDPIALTDASTDVSTDVLPAVVAID